MGCVFAFAALVVRSGAAGRPRSVSASPSAAGRLASVPGSPGLGVFVSAEGRGSGTALVLRSATTGRVLRTLGTFGLNFTNNGLALSPDGRDVYFTLIGNNRSPNLLLERIRVNDRKRTKIGPGEEPAISPDGRLLAYTTDARHAQAIVVRDLATGVTRRINVSRLLGMSGDLLLASLAWSSDSGSVIVLPGSVAIPANGNAARHPAQTRTTANLLLVKVGAGRQPLAARRVAITGLSGYPDAITPSSSPGIVLATALVGSNAVLDQIRFSGPVPQARRILSIPSGLVLGLDATGQRIFYLRGHSPPALWTASITSGKLADQKRLLRSSPVQALAW